MVDAIIDAVTAIIGSAVMIGFLLLIANKLAELPLWIVVIAGIAMMLYAFWKDAFEPLLKHLKA